MSDKEEMDTTKPVEAQESVTDIDEAESKVELEDKTNAGSKVKCQVSTSPDDTSQPLESALIKPTVRQDGDISAEEVSYPEDKSNIDHVLEVVQENTFLQPEQAVQDQQIAQDQQPVHYQQHVEGRLPEQPQLPVQPQQSVQHLYAVQPQQAVQDQLPLQNQQHVQPQLPVQHQQDLQHLLPMQLQQALQDQQAMQLQSAVQSPVDFSDTPNMNAIQKLFSASVGTADGKMSYGILREGMLARGDEVIENFASPSLTYKKGMFFSSGQKDSHSFKSPDGETITSYAVIAEDAETELITADVVDGGIGMRHIKVEVKNHQEGPWKYRVVVWGKKTSAF